MSVYSEESWRKVEDIEELEIGKLYLLDFLNKNFYYFKEKVSLIDYEVYMFTILNYDFNVIEEGSLEDSHLVKFVEKGHFYEIDLDYLSYSQHAKLLLIKN